MFAYDDDDDCVGRIRGVFVRPIVGADNGCAIDRLDTLCRSESHTELRVSSIRTDRRPNVRV